MTRKIIEIGSNNLDLLEILLQGPEEWNYWREQNSKTIINLRGANLRGANLRGANLREAYLIKADLCGANLREADLWGADLSRANLSQANLSQANLKGAYLVKAQLTGANLTGANLTGAKLIGATVREAKLRGANLRGADLSEIERTEIDATSVELRYSLLDEPIKLNTKSIDFNINNTSTDFHGVFTINVFDSEINPKVLKELNKAIKIYKNTFGYEEIEVIDEHYGSWFNKTLNKLTKIIPHEAMETIAADAVEIYKYGMDNIKNKLAQPGINTMHEMADSIATILKCIEPIDNTVIELDKLLIIKQTLNNGQSQIYVIAISFDLKNKLQKIPEIKDTETIICALQDIGELPEPINSKDHLPPAKKKMKS